MAEAANYKKVIQQGDVTLPDRSNPNPDADFAYGTFGAPGVRAALSRSLTARSCSSRSTPGVSASSNSSSTGRRSSPRPSASETFTR